MDSGPKHLFGLQQNKDQRVFNAEDDYEQKFPEDPIFRETGPNARVWRTYLAESAIFDDNMIGEARDGLDSMVVFAGLFSAVVTSFLIEASQNLQADYTQLSATLLYELVSNSSGGSLSPLNPLSEFVPDARDVWINGLWAISLTLSLVVALASVLIKQWLRRYLAFRSGTPAERSHLRQYRFMGFETWHVPTIVGSLPVIMHLSLALFLIGLVLFFIPLHFALSCVIGGITLAVYMLYFASNILPIFIPECPYRTPFSTFFLFLGRSIRCSVVLGHRQIQLLFGALDDHLNTNLNYLQSSLDDLESSAVQVAADNVVKSLSVHSLHWLFSTSTNLSVHSIVLQAIGGLPAHNQVRQTVQSVFDFRRVCQPALKHLISSCTSATELRPSCRVPIQHLESALERLCRTLLFFSANSYEVFGHLEDFDLGSRPNDPESLLRKGTFLTVQHLTLDGQDYLDFVVNNRSTKHHFFVWEAFLKNANQYGHYEQCEYSTKAILSYYDDLFPRKPYYPPVEPSSNEISFLDAIAILPEYNTLIRSWMLKMLSGWQNLHQTFPQDSQIIAAMLQFLLHHVWNDLPEEEFWKYLNNVLHHFDIVEADQRFHEDESCGISISSFIVKLCENWMSRPGYQPSALDHLLVEKVKTEWNTKLVRGPSDRAIILVRATEKLQVQFQTHSTTFAEFAVLAIDLPHVLRYGSVKAHCSFIDNNYLTLLYEHYKTQPQSHYIPDLVSNFVPALDSQDVKSPERAKCVDHLFEHQNSRYAIILVILELEDQMDWVDTPSILAQLCPLRQLLIDLRDWLKLVAKFLDATHKEDRECLREEIGMDPLLFSDQHSERLKDFIHSFDNYLAYTQYQPEPLPLQEGTVVVRGRPQTAENSWIVSRSSALHW